MLSVKLGHLDRWNLMRQDSARVYDRLLADVQGIITPTVLDGVQHVYHLYVVRLTRGSRDELRAYLDDQGVQSSIHYPHPLHLTAALSGLGYRRGEFPVAEQCAETVLSLPMFPGLEMDQIQFVVKQIRKYLGEA